MKCLIIRMPNGQMWRVNADAIIFDMRKNAISMDEEAAPSDDVLIQHLRRMTWEEALPFAIRSDWPDDMEEQFAQAEIEVIEHTPEYDPTEVLRKNLDKDGGE